MEFGPSYVPSTLGALRTTILSKEADTVHPTTKHVGASWECKDISLIIDGQSDTHSLLFHGVFAYSRGQACCMSASHALETRQTTKALFKESLGVAEDVRAGESRPGCNRWRVGKLSSWKIIGGVV